MGVIRLNQPLDPIRQPGYVFEDHILDYVFDESPDHTDNEENIQVAQQQAQTPRRRRQRQSNARNRNLPRPQDMNAALRHGQKGARKHKRIEDARLLSTMVDPDDICDDLSDTLPSTVTAFSELFVNDDAMKSWYEFMELDESEQAVFLEQGIDWVDEHEPSSSAFTLGAHKQMAGSSRHAKQSTKYGAKHSGTTPKTKSKAFCAEQSYLQVDRMLRQLLTAGNVPWGKVDHFESELTEFFLSSSDGVYVCQVPTSYDRLLLHATAQYLTLHSKSINQPDGNRQTEVENRRPYFIPPRTGLSDYVNKMKSPRRKRR